MIRKDSNKYTDLPVSYMVNGLKIVRFFLNFLDFQDFRFYICTLLPSFHTPSPQKKSNLQDSLQFQEDYYSRKTTLSPHWIWIFDPNTLDIKIVSQ